MGGMTPYRSVSTCRVPLEQVGQRSSKLEDRHVSNPHGALVIEGDSTHNIQGPSVYDSMVAKNPFPGHVPNSPSDAQRGGFSGEGRKGHKKHSPLLQPFKSSHGLRDNTSLYTYRVEI